jgi:cobalt-zinc-cadmium efflux system membrane fusion protein
MKTKEGVMQESASTSTEVAAAEAPPSASGRRVGVLVGVVAVAGLIGVGVWLARSHQEAAAPARSEIQIEKDAVVLDNSAAQLKYVEVKTAEEGAPLPPLPAPARVTFAESRSAPVFAALAGRVDSVVVQLGQEVKAGDRLVAVRSSSLPDLNRDLENARAALGVKTSAADRVRDLVHLRAVAEKDLMLAEAERREAEIAVRAAEGKRRSLGLGAVDASGLYWITAPRAGTVVERRALVGMEVGPDRTDPLVMIADLREVVVVADLLEGDVGGIRAGQTAEVRAGNDDPLGGTVEYVAALVDPVRRTVAVRVRVANPDGRLRPNAFAHVTLHPAEGERRVVVPAEAVVTDGQSSVLFVRTAAGQGRQRFLRREVRLGRSRDGRSEILEGIKAGEAYVAGGALLLLNAIDLGS